MGVQKTEVEATSTVPAEKMFKGLLLEMDHIVPKAFPQAVKSIENIEGDGGVGTIKLVTLGEASQFSTIKQRIDAIDKDTMTYSYSIVGGDILMDFMESVIEHFSVTATDGGCIVKNTTTYTTKGDIVIPEENIKQSNDQSMKVFKAVEAYLLAN